MWKYEENMKLKIVSYAWEFYLLLIEVAYYAMGLDTNTFQKTCSTPPMLKHLRGSIDIIDPPEAATKDTSENAVMDTIYSFDAIDFDEILLLCEPEAK